MLNNAQVYSTVQFDYWANKENLIIEEKYLIENYLNKKAKTLEAGTGGGRILLEMKEMGFSSLYGYDYVPKLVERAKQKDPRGSIAFEVQDATSLKYENSSFDQIMYLQQIICLIEEEMGRVKALREAYRILKPGGTALFSFLSFDVRSKSNTYRPYLSYLKLFRYWQGANRSIQYLPWLKHSGKYNFSALFDSKPYVYWYKLEEAYQFFKSENFEVIALGSSFQIKNGKMLSTIEALRKEPIEGMLYFVCKK